MASLGCQPPSGWSMVGAAPTYSAFAGILCGFLFAGITTLITTDRRDSSGSERPAEGAPNSAAEVRARVDRSAALMLFLPSFLCLVVSCFLFGEVSGDQVCVRADVGGLFASSFLAVGTLGIFSGISWLLDVYVESNEELRRTSTIFTYISYGIVLVALLVYAEDFIKDIFNNKPPRYILGVLPVYALTLIAFAVAAHRRSSRGRSGGRRAQFTAIYFPAAFVLATILTLSLLNSYGPAAWHSLNDWKVYLALGVALSFPGVIMIAYARSLPGLSVQRTDVGVETATRTRDRSRAEA